MSQPRWEGGREHGSESLIPEINRRLKSIAAANGVSVGWVKSKILADAVGVKEQPDYKTAKSRSNIKLAKRR